ncbi:hypothetical protein [Leucobacter japonicus]|uniref:hypothetical protein n=1 Tax=Leucobacter japonicus TaxID=1461259 RepID=UPI0012E1D543|nr:hypothetical protein [Leucobacter japonicus]
MAAPLKPCGTLAAYRRHLRNGESACAECLAAVAADKQRRSDERRAAQAAQVRSVMSIVPDVPSADSHIDELAEAYSTLQWIKDQMNSGVAQGAAALAKQRMEIVALIKKLESEGKPEVSALDEIARKRAARLAASSN